MESDKTAKQRFLKLRCLSKIRYVGLSRQEELSDVTDVKNPDGTTAAERRLARLEAEASAFSPDHYL